jgi:ammonium transporter, Amt family
MMKSLMIMATVGFTWWAVGYGFAYGDNKTNGTRNGFIGNGKIFLQSDRTGFPEREYAVWLVTAKFAIETTIIATQSLAERTKTIAYVIMALLISGVLHPVVVHWIWSTGGWLSFFTTPDLVTLSAGVIDLAGAGTVHCLGGFIALAGTLLVGARQGEFADVKKETTHYYRNQMYRLFGSLLILWGSLAFIVVSSKTVTNGAPQFLAKAAINVVLSSATGALTAYFVNRWLSGKYCLWTANQGMLTALAAVCACAHIMEPWSGFLTGLTSGLVYLGGRALLRKMHIDDPVETVTVHGFGGAWGLLTAGWFAVPQELQAFYGRGNGVGGVFYHGDAEQFGVQCLAFIVIASWGLFVGALLFFIVRFLGLLRVTSEVESDGLDSEPVRAVKDNEAEPKA